MSDQRVRNFRTSDETWEALGALCARRGTTRSDLLRELVQDLLATDKREASEAPTRFVLGVFEVSASLDDGHELLMTPISGTEAAAILERFRELGR
jgi:hypothetical protein